MSKNKDKSIYFSWFTQLAEYKSCKKVMASYKEVHQGKTIHVNTLYNVRSGHHMYFLKPPGEGTMVDILKLRNFALNLCIEEECVRDDAILLREHWNDKLLNLEIKKLFVKYKVDVFNIKSSAQDVEGKIKKVSVEFFDKEHQKEYDKLMNSIKLVTDTDSEDKVLIEVLTLYLHLVNNGTIRVDRRDTFTLGNGETITIG